MDSSKLSPLKKKIKPVNDRNTHTYKTQKHVNALNDGLIIYIHDRAKTKGLQIGEVGGFREAGPENAIIYHSEIEGRNEEILTVITAVGDGSDRWTQVSCNTQLDYFAHLTLFSIPLFRLALLLRVMELELKFVYFHIKLYCKNCDFFRERKAERLNKNKY